MKSKWPAWMIGILAVFLPIFGCQPGEAAGMLVSARENAPKTEEMQSPLQLEVILERTYLDGEISEEKIMETVWSIEDFWEKYDQWQVKDMHEGQVVFRREVNDISPLLKSNGYFGITEDGTLTIFNGRPKNSIIIQSFFQIDLGKLESTKREQLENGIPVMTKARYEKVLDAFQSYSTKKEN